MTAHAETGGARQENFPPYRSRGGRGGGASGHGPRGLGEVNAEPGERGDDCGRRIRRVGRPQREWCGRSQTGQRRERDADRGFMAASARFAVPRHRRSERRGATHRGDDGARRGPGKQSRQQHPHAHPSFHWEDRRFAARSGAAQIERQCRGAALLSLHFQVVVQMAAQQVERRH